MHITKNSIISFYNGKNQSKGRVVGIVQRVDEVIMEIIHYDIEQYNKLEKFTIGITPMHELTIHDTEESIEELIDDLKMDQEDLIKGCQIELKLLLNQTKKRPIKKLERELQSYEAINLNLLEKTMKQSLKKKIITQHGTKSKKRKHRFLSSLRS